MLKENPFGIFVMFYLKGLGKKSLNNPWLDSQLTVALFLLISFEFLFWTFSLKWDSQTVKHAAVCRSKTRCQKYCNFQ
jgi:glycopeptide antibiotics resistance protein